MDKKIKKIDDNIGKQYNFITILELVKKHNTHKFYKSLCSCGNVFIAIINNIKRGNTKSCGCFQHKLMKTRFKTHGKSTSPEYNVYKTMINRCKDINHIQYKNYGGRGITVCDRWKESFENFITDMGQRPKPKYQIDRIDNNGQYSKENCRWVSPKQNCKNGTMIKFYEYENKNWTIKELCSKFNINRECVRKRLIRGWSLHKALTTPSKNLNSKPELNIDRFV